MAERLRCVVERITYQNAENGYSVIKCAAKGYNDLVTVVGNMAEVHVGSVLSLTGSWRIDSKYGRQFSIESYEETLPATVYGIEKYLGSGLVKGIGPKFAKRIVSTFRADTAKRELYEETGATDYTLKRICVYSVTAPDNFSGQETFGMLYLVEIRSFEKELHSEIEKIIISDHLVNDWTYPLIQPKLIEEARRRGFT